MTLLSRRNILEFTRPSHITFFFILLCTSWPEPTVACCCSELMQFCEETVIVLMPLLGPKTIIHLPPPSPWKRHFKNHYLYWYSVFLRHILNIVLLRCMYFSSTANFQLKIEVWFSCKLKKLQRVLSLK